MAKDTPDTEESPPRNSAGRPASERATHDPRTEQIEGIDNEPRSDRSPDTPDMATTQDQSAQEERTDHRTQQANTDTGHAEKSTATRRDTPPGDTPNGQGSTTTDSHQVKEVTNRDTSQASVTTALLAELENDEVTDSQKQQLAEHLHEYLRDPEIEQQLQYTEERLNRIERLAPIAEELHKNLGNIENLLQRVQNLQTRVTKLESSTDGMEATLDDVEEVIDTVKQFINLDLDTE